MTTVAIPSDLMNALRNYLAEFTDYSAGELLEDAFEYAMTNVEDFEEHIGVEEDSEEETSEEDDSEDIA